jgi:hypothetical protein
MFISPRTDVSYMANDNEKDPFAPMDDVDRERGIYTPRDRRFLLGQLDDELDANEQRVKRHRLRHRTAHAVQDLAYLGYMDTADLVQIYQQFGNDTGDVENMTLDEERRQRLIQQATDNMVGFIHELLGTDRLEQLIERDIGQKVALDHYEETGEVGVFDVSIEVELTESISIDELVARMHDEHGRTTGYTLPPGAGAVLDVAGFERPSYEPQTNLLETMVQLVDELGEGDTAAKSDVLDELVDREGVDRDTAEEVYEDLLMTGRAYEPEKDVITTF